MTRAHSIDRRVCLRKKMARLCGLVVVPIVFAAFIGCERDGISPKSVSASTTSAKYTSSNSTRSAYFGDLHVHTSYSFDAFISGTRNDPSAAYRFAKGEMITLADGSRQRLDVPLDFAAVTDHAELFADYAYCTNASSTIYDSEYCRHARMGNSIAIDEIIDALTQRPPQRVAVLRSEELDPREVAKGAWQDIQQAAEQFNQPDVFTTFIGFEYSPLLPDAGMLHRNVIFRGSTVPEEALGAITLESPERLWAWLDHVCIDDCEVLAIPHNTNYTWGIAFRETNTDGTPFTMKGLRQRARLEPLIELIQAKGSSECTIGLGTTDEECGFEQVYLPCQNGQETGCVQNSSLVREGLKTGLIVEEKLGVNPFKYGFVGSTDTHNANAGATAESNYHGHNSFDDDTPHKRLNPASADSVSMNSRYNAGGLAGVWAEENTRDSIFDALKRKETFATSGTRIRVRFFAGWNYSDRLHQQVDMLDRAYANGVPMGGELTTTPSRNKAPRFLVWAAADPNSARLERVQIIKGWIEDGEPRERIYDVACSDAIVSDSAIQRCAVIGAAVDITDCRYTKDKGAAELRTTWMDPDFDDSQPAFYYVRVLENPTCRWSTLDAIRSGIDPPGSLPLTIKERAWSSPIWYTPAY